MSVMNSEANKGGGSYTPNPDKLMSKVRNDCVGKISVSLRELGSLEGPSLIICHTMHVGTVVIRGLCGTLLSTCDRVERRYVVALCFGGV